jgi:hypothetical protein
MCADKIDACLSAIAHLAAALIIRDESQQALARRHFARLASVHSKVNQ